MNRAQQRRPFHARQQILGLVHRLDKARITGAGAQKLRAQGEYRVKALAAGFGLAASFRLLEKADQDVDEQPCLIGAGLLGKAEQLLELVDQDADPVGGVSAKQVFELGGRSATGVEHPADLANKIR